MIDPITMGQVDLWGLVLAGGEGKRLEDYVRQLHGTSLPKQYVNFIGTRSMLQHTWDRAERLIPGRKILTIVTEHHLLAPEVCRQLACRTPGTVIVQPANKDTGRGYFFPSPISTGAVLAPQWRFSHRIISFSTKIASLTMSVLRPARCIITPPRSYCWLWKLNGRNPITVTRVTRSLPMNVVRSIYTDAVK